MQTYEPDTTYSTFPRAPRVRNTAITSPAATRLFNDYEDIPDNEVYFEKLHKILTGPPFIGVPPEPSAFLDLVYVGTIAQSENLELLKRLKFTHVLNCAGLPTTLKQSRKARYKDSGIRYEELPIDDSERFDILPYFSLAHSFISSAPYRSRILIADHGVSRSGAIAISYMIKRGSTLLKAADIFKKIRRVALCNEGFMRALVAYARSCQMLDPDPGQIKAPVYGRKLDSYRIRSAHLPTVL